MLLRMKETESRRGRRWRNRAEELLAIAEDMVASEPRAMMEAIAADYLKLANGEMRECSICKSAIAQNASPIEMWSSEGWGIKVCDDCAVNGRKTQYDR